MRCVTKTCVVFSFTLFALLVAVCVILSQWHEEIVSNNNNVLRGNSGSNVQINVTSNSDNNNVVVVDNTNHTFTSLCLVSIIDVEEDDEEEQTRPTKNLDEILVCNKMNPKTSNGVTDHFFLLRNFPVELVRANQNALMKNEWFIEYEKDWVNYHTAAIVIPNNASIPTIDPSLVPEHHSIDSSHRRELTTNLQERKRKLEMSLGKRRVVVVSVALKSTSLQQLYEHAFGTENSLASQMAACSQGQVIIEPHPQYPIIQVTPKKEVSEYTFVELYNDILQDIKQQIGLNGGASVLSTTDHLFLVVPDSISRRPGELGWGSTPGFFSGIIESLAPSTMTMLHEIGHNFGLGHAYEQGVAYSDMSTVMGYSHRDVVKMCYNGHNMWDMGWYKDRSYQVRLGSGNVNTDNDPEVIKLAFYGDYSKSNEATPVIVRYQDIYMTFNRKVGMNAETKEYADMLLVVQEMPGDFHSHTDLIAALGVGDNTFLIDSSAFVQVCSFTPGNDYYPDYLTIVLGKQKSGCPTSTGDIVTSMSDSMGGQGNLQINRGVEVSKSETLALAEESLECKMIFPWVELVNPLNSMDVDYVLCPKVGADPELYCDQIDDASQQEVWKVCRLQCPQSGCMTSPLDKTPEDSLSTNPPAGARTTTVVEHCYNLFSWVEIELTDEYGNKEYIRKNCDEMEIGFQQTREDYCNKYDTLTQLKVSEICRVGCPNTGCSR